MQLVVNVMTVEKGLQHSGDGIIVEFVDRYFALGAVAKKCLGRY